MNIDVRETWFKFGLAFLAVAVFSSTALAQDRDAGHVTGTSPNRASLSASSAKPVNGVAEFRAPAAAAQVEVIHLPVFGAAGLMKKGSQTIRLAGLMITSVDAQCGSGPDAWPCGRMALGAVQRFVRGRSVECRRPEGNAARLVHCSVGGQDIGEWLVAQGWVRASGPDYADAEKAAQKEKRGVWGSARPGLAMSTRVGGGTRPQRCRCTRRGPPFDAEHDIGAQG